MTAESNAKRRKTGEQKEIKWEAVHREEFMALGLDWPIEDLSAVDACLAQNVSCLCRRSQEIAFIVHLKYQKHEEETVYDLNPTVAWDAHGIGQTPCIVCSATLWLRQQQRLLHGSELLYLQGLPPDQIKNLESLDHNKMVELAGNAFCAFHMMPVLLSLFALFPWPMEFNRRGGDDEPFEQPSQPDSEEEGPFLESVESEEASGYQESLVDDELD